MNATVVVLGEIGRSPRMQYHALALADAGASVTVTGYGGTDLFPGLADRVRVRALSPPRVSNPRALARPFYVAYSLAKLARQAIALGAALLEGPRPDVVLVQSPPALPTIAVAAAVVRLRRSRLVIDWHNLGTPLLERTLGGKNLLTRLHARAERALAKRADAHLCVSEAMRQAIGQWGVKAEIFYDRPAAFFAPAREAGDQQLHAVGIASTPSRPLVVVAPTGWTEEEDTDLLLRALDATERTLDVGRGASTSPALVVVLTGRGPRRVAFENEAAARTWKHVDVRTVWLDPGVYPAFLSACDAGLSLHRSFSGLDLAMKVEDLLGSGLPVLALDHGAVREQVQKGRGGWLFHDEGDLARALVALVQGGLGNDPLRRLRGEIRGHPRRGFPEEWNATARRVILP